MLHRAGKEGLGKAYVAGFREALAHGRRADLRDGRRLLSHDADVPAPASCASSTRAPTSCSARATSRAAGSRTGGSPRKIISRGGCLYAQTILGLPLHDLTGGYKCFRRRVLETIDLDAIDTKGYGFQIEMTYRVYKMGFRVVELPIIFVDRKVGESKMSNDIVVEAMKNVWKLRFSGVPARRPG